MFNFTVRSAAVGSRNRSPDVLISDPGRFFSDFCGGLVFSQGVTLFVTPGPFLCRQALQGKVLDKFELTRAGSSRKEA
jgi:hypothetical protein